MSTPVVTVASGGLPVVELAAGKLGLPVTEATNGRGIAVTKVVGMPGLPVVFDTIGVAPPVAPVTLDPATVTAVTLSGGNLVATNTGTTSTNQGARVADAGGKTSGKYYFEMTNTVNTTGGSIAVGICTTTSAYTNVALGTVGNVSVRNTGNIWANGADSTITIGSFASGGQRIDVAVDLDNRRIWFRKGAGNWNNNVANNPATNVGGIVIPAGTMVPVVVFGGSAGAAGNAFTANFGATAFAGAVPAGFTSGWLA